MKLLSWFILKSQLILINNYIVLILLGSVFFTPFVFSGQKIDLDIDSLIHIADNNPDDIGTRLILANYYLEESDFFNSKQLIEYALERDAKNENIIRINEKWNRLNNNKILLDNLKIDNIDNTERINVVVKQEYKKNNIIILSQLFDLLGNDSHRLNTESNIIHASILVEDEKFKKALGVISFIQEESDQRIQLIVSKACYGLNNMACAIPPLQSLFAFSADLEIGLQLIDALIIQGQTYDATRIYQVLKKREIEHPKMDELGQQLEALFSIRLNKAENNYKENPTSKNFLTVMKLLIQNGDDEMLYLALKTYINNNPDDDEVKLFSANQYAFSKKYSVAIKILKSLNKQTPRSQLLQAKYAVWSGKKTKEARGILVDLLNKFNKEGYSSLYTPKTINESSLLLANIYLWGGHKNKASKVLEPIVNLGNSSDEIQEAYLLATNKNNILIEIYKNKLKGDKNNAQLVLKLARLHQSVKHKKKALQYFEQYIEINPEDVSIENEVGLLYISQKKYKKGFKLLKSQAYRLNTKKSLLNLANNYYWNGFNVDSLKTVYKIKRQYPRSKKVISLMSKLEKEPLNRRDKNLTQATYYYDKGKFDKAIPFFGAYLKIYDKDYFIRFKYGYSFSKIGSYTKSVNEFRLVSKSINDNLNNQYFLAYNLELIHEEKEAKGIYIQIIDKINNKELAFGGIKESDSKLKKLSSDRIAIIDKNKDVIVNDIYLGGGVKKIIKAESKIFSSVFVPSSKINKNEPYSAFVADDVLYSSTEDVEQVDIDFEYISDKAGVSFINPNVKVNYQSWPYDISVSANGFRFEDDNCTDKFGGSIEIYGKYNKSISTQIGGGVKIDQFEGSTEFSPFISLNFEFDKSNVEIQAYKRSLFYEKLSCGLFTEHYSKYGMQFSGNMEFSKYQSLWYSIDAGYIDDDNVEVIPQYNLVVFKDRYVNDFIPIKYEIAIDGYYMWNRKQKDSYYSPDFFDSTVLSINPTFNITKEFDLAIQSSIGYSLSEKSTIFRYGVWAKYLFKNQVGINAGCERSNIGSSSAGGSNYNYNHCVLSIGYAW